MSAFASAELTAKRWSTKGCSPRNARALRRASAERDLGSERSLFAHSDTEGSKIQNDHYKGKKVHSHCQPNRRVDSQNKQQTKQTGLPFSKEKWVNKFE